MFVYIGLIVFYFIAICLDFKNVIKQKYKILFCIALFLPLILLCSFKNINVGNDTQGYYNYYWGLKELSEYQTGYFEKGFHIFSYIFARLKVPLTIYMLVCYSIVYVPFILISYKWINKPSLVAFSLFLFLFTNFALSALRQSISIGICLFGFFLFYLFYKKKDTLHLSIGITLQIIFITIAYFFHRSALIFIVVPLLCLYRNRLLKNPFLLIAVMLLFSLVSPYFYGIIDNLLNRSIVDSSRSKFFLNLGFSTWITYALLLVSHLLTASTNGKFDMLYSRYPKIKPYLMNPLTEESDNNRELEIMSQNLSVLYLLFLTLFSVSNVFKRIVMYLVPFICFSYAFLFNRVGNKRIEKILLFASFCGLIIYAYFATIKSGYLTVSNYEFGFYL